MAPLFRFDTNSPYAYLAASRVDEVLGAGVVWQPIAFAFLLRAQGRRPWSLDGSLRGPGMAECAARAQAYGLPPLRWPPGWPADSYTVEPLRAILAATAHGREREVARAAFRRTFVTGEGLRAPGAVLACWEEAGLDPAAFEPEVGAAKQTLTDVTDRAIAEEVPGVPCVTVEGAHFWGDDQLPAAAAATA